MHHHYISLLVTRVVPEKKIDSFGIEELVQSQFLARKVTDKFLETDLSLFGREILTDKNG